MARESDSTWNTPLRPPDVSVFDRVRDPGQLRLCRCRRAPPTIAALLALANFRILIGGLHPERALRGCSDRRKLEIYGILLIIRYIPYDPSDATRRIVSRKFSDFMDELREEAKRTGTESDLALFEEHFRLAGELSERRRSLGISQKKLSDQTGIHQSEISRLERGSGNPTLRTLSVIATALHGRVDLVFSPQKRSSSKRRPRKRG